MWLMTCSRIACGLPFCLGSRYFVVQSVYRKGKKNFVSFSVHFALSFIVLCRHFSTLVENKLCFDKT